MAAPPGSAARSASEVQSARVAALGDGELLELSDAWPEAWPEAASDDEQAETPSRRTGTAAASAARRVADPIRVDVDMGVLLVVRGRPGRAFAEAGDAEGFPVVVVAGSGPVAGSPRW
jgi:hypothetical protein